MIYPDVISMCPCVWESSGQLDLHVVAQAVNEAEQPVGGKSIEVASEQLRHFGLPDAKQLGGFGLGKATTLDNT
jgi:hypothetical protein